MAQYAQDTFASILQYFKMKDGVNTKHPQLYKKLELSSHFSMTIEHPGSLPFGGIGEGGQSADDAAARVASPTITEVYSDASYLTP